MLAKKSTKMAKLWLDLCDIQHKHGLFGLVSPETVEFKTLETMGFITSTETSDLLIVKVNQEEDFFLGPFFCGGKCEE
jgi:hypothetical protein